MPPATEEITRRRPLPSVAERRQPRAEINRPSDPEGRTGGLYFASEKTHLQFIHSGSTMLDCALGGGWVLGRVANIIGDKCLSGDTIVSAQRGTKPKKMPMRVLYERFKGTHYNSRPDAETHLIADMGGYVGLVRMLDMVMSGEKTLYEMTTDRGSSIKASKDHKFSTTEGWLTLDTGLKIGEYVNCWRGTRRQSTYVRAERPITYSIPYHPFGWQHLIGGRNYKRMLTARLVIEAAINGLTLPELITILRKDPARAATLQYSDISLEVHHLDGDPTNDVLSNLELVSSEEHWETHAGEMNPDTKRIEPEQIVSVRNVGREETFDITMEAPFHNFVANNFVVHNSTGKTLLAIEAMANFAKGYPRGKVFFRERESAFDKKYAEAFGLPINRVDFGPEQGDKRFSTVEGFHDDLLECIEKAKRAKVPAIYILDSFDALSADAEMKREIGDASYGGDRAKKMSELFRRLVRPLEENDVLLMIISQIRDNIGAMFGKKTKRMGGHALDFYATHVIELAHMEYIEKTISKVKRKVGIDVKALVSKNKVGLTHRDVRFDIQFGFGVDDLTSCLDWLIEVDHISKLGLDKDTALKFLVETNKLPDEDYRLRVNEVAAATKVAWREIEAQFLPQRRKY